MDVILTAGGIPSQKDPLHTAARGGYKAMIDINGKPMIQWVLNALSSAAKIERIILVGLPPVTDLNSAKPIIIVEEQGDLLSNIRAGCHEVSSQHTGEEHVLLVAADIPLLEPHMVDWMVDQVSTSEADVNYGLVDKALMESTFPGARKNFITLKEQQICGGEMNAIRLKIAGSGDPVWQRLVEARKNPLKLASVAGYDTMFLLQLRQRTISEVEKSVQSHFGFTCRALLSPYPEIAADVDKPYQLALVKTALRKRHEAEP